MVYALLSLVRRGVKRPQIWACVVEAIIKLLASESNIGQRDRQLLFNKFFTRQVSVGNRLVWKCTRNLKYCRLFDYLLAETCNAARRITKWININLVFIFQIPKHIYSLLSFSCRVKISIGDNRTLNSCRLFWADRRKFSRRVKEISRVWRRSKIVPDNRLAHVESRIQCRSVSKVGPCNPYSLMYTIIVRSIIWIQRSKHYIWSIHLSKGLFGYRVCSLCLCYLLSSVTSVYSNSDQCKKINNEWPHFFYLPAIISLGLLAHGWYLLLSTPCNGYVPSLQERGLRIARGSISLVMGFTLGGYALQNIDPIFSENASAFGSACVSAATYGRAENVMVAPIVIAKFEFGNIERQIFAVDLVISSDNAALDERPEAFNRIGVNSGLALPRDRARAGVSVPIAPADDRLL
jgi:hypothetical protein